MNIFVKHRSNLFSLRAKIKALAVTAAFGFSLLGAPQAQAQTAQFRNGETNPFGLVNLSPMYTANPNFVDLDNDGDMDILVGAIKVSTYSGEFRYFENIGTATAPAFAAPLSNPFGLSPTYQFVSPELVDLDGDGDLDILAGVNQGNFEYFENVGTASAPAFAASQTNPFSLTATTGLGFPSLADLDNDGDMDLLANDFSGTWSYFENIGTASSPTFAAVQANPFGLNTITGGVVGNAVVASFHDLDVDGDLDIMFGRSNSTFTLITNVGTATAPAFDTLTVNPFGLSNQSDYLLASTFADLDGDGDMDLLAGSSYSNFYYYQNFSCVATNPLTAQNDTLFANNSGLVYTWFDCATNTALAYSAYNYFVPNMSGNFYVFITSVGCDYTSPCFNFTFSSVAEAAKSEIALYPNPTNGLINLTVSQDWENAELRIINVNGQTVASQSKLQTGSLGLNVSNLPAGLYTLELKNSEKIARQKFNKL